MPLRRTRNGYRLFSEGRFDVPLRAVINGSHGNFLFMPAYCEDMGAAGLKIVNIMPGNPEKGLPASIGQVLLIDGETGVVKAMMDGTHVTALRTAAASGAAFDLFGRKDAQTGAMIGTGSQAMCRCYDRDRQPGDVPARGDADCKTSPRGKSCCQKL